MRFIINEIYKQKLKTTVHIWMSTSSLKL